ncbi:hypothetical protein [Youxingia wuxianensis]|uniref:Uncharacterized protein n=1 Tax=Youxingia wuxianensis TaxID=2763678 RepID=A0A926ES97_9FIRM|nr:hypothetical protein [Youxingia wuxianensis]MBC8585340.1 hypothetical protein [Youxingia wuxianensis]
MEEKKVPAGDMLSVILPLLIAIMLLLSAAGCAIYQYASAKAYREKWKDYNDCGLA